MRRQRRSRAPWRWAAAIGTVILVIFWIRHTQQVDYRHGGTTFGLVTGTIGLLLMLLLAFFGVRRRWYSSRLGTLEGWLQAHIWIGVVSIFVVAFHTGFRFQDRVAVALLWVFGAVAVSGIIGAVLYSTVPRALTEVEGNLPGDAISEQINQLAKSMARVASNKSETFQSIYRAMEREVRPSPLAGWILLFRGRVSRTGPPPWSHLVESVPKSEQGELRQMILLSRQQKELHSTLRDQKRYRNLLEVWRLIHLPLSIALLLLLVAHVWGALRYASVPW